MSRNKTPQVVCLYRNDDDKDNGEDPKADNGNDTLKDKVLNDEKLVNNDDDCRHWRQ